MNRRIIVLIGIAIFLFIIIGADYISKMQKSDNKGPIMNDSSGSVMEVTSDSFDEEVLQSDKKVLIDFYATWCGPCKTLSPIVEKVAKEQKDVKSVKIDTDKNEGLASQYGINAIPTLVVIENGKEIDRSVGLVNEREIIDLLTQ